MKKVIVSLLMLICLIDNIVNASTIIKPKSNNSVYLAAIANIGKIHNIVEIQVELARVGFQIVRQQNPLEVLKMTGANNDEQQFAIQIYDDGKIIFYGLRNPKRQGEIAKTLCEMFIQGKIGDDFYSALIGAAQFRPQVISSLKNIKNWQWYAVDSGTWTLGRVYAEKYKKSNLYLRCNQQPDYVFFRFLWNLTINGSFLNSSDIVDHENHAQRLKIADNILSLNLGGVGDSRYFYFLFDSPSAVSCDEKNLDVQTFDADFIGDLWQQ